MLGCIGKLVRLDTAKRRTIMNQILFSYGLQMSLLISVLDKSEMQLISAT